jgi:hypothetical protein
LPVPGDLPFPHVSQVFLIERYVTGLHGQPISAVAALGVASPKPEQADAADLARGSAVSAVAEWWLSRVSMGAWAHHPVLVADTDLLAGQGTRPTSSVCGSGVQDRWLSAAGRFSQIGRDLEGFIRILDGRVPSGSVEMDPVLQPPDGAQGGQRAN